MAMSTHKVAHREAEDQRGNIYRNLGVTVDDVQAPRDRHFSPVPHYVYLSSEREEGVVE